MPRFPLARLGTIAAHSAAVFALSAGLMTSVVQAQPVPTLPTIRTGTAPLVTPGDAQTYYNAQGLTSPASGPADPMMVRTAKALKSDIDQIYGFVRNEIEMVPTFGLKGGARGALIDKRGTPFDQTALFVELARAAGYTAEYQLGTITLTGAEFTARFGVSDAALATKLLGNGGIPATVSASGSVINSVTLMHMWAKVTIGGTAYHFDPGLKPSTWVAGVNVDTIMGLNVGTLLATANTGSTTDTTNGTPRARGFNRAGIRSTIQTYATNLLTHIRTNMPNASITDLAGGATIQPYTGPNLRQASLPYWTSTTSTFTGDVPDSLKARLRLTFVGNPAVIVTLSADKIYGKSLVLRAFPGGYAAIWDLMLGGDVINGSVSTPQSIEALMPYAAQSGTYMDTSTVLSIGAMLGATEIFHGWGSTGRDFGQYIEAAHINEDDEQDISPSGCGLAEGDGHGQQMPIKRRIGARYLSQTQSSLDLLQSLGAEKVQTHYVLGIAQTVFTDDDGCGPDDTSYRLNVEAGFSVSGASSTAEAAMARTLSTVMSVLEGSVAEQISDSPSPVSTAVKLDWATANAPTQWFYYTTPANWTWVQTQLLNDYWGGITATTTTAGNYLNAGYELVLAQSSHLGPGDDYGPRMVNSNNGNNMPVTIGIFGVERGAAFVAEKTDNSAFAPVVVRLGQMSKGGGGSDTKPDKVFSIPEDFLDRQFKARAESFSIDMKTGVAAIKAAPDITVGNGDYPYSLSFQRSFRTGADTHKTPLSGPGTMSEPEFMFRTTGWTSNFNRQLVISSDLETLFGEDKIERAAATIATLRALRGLAQGSTSQLDTVQRTVTSAVVAAWWAEQAAANTATIVHGADSRVFVRLTDGTWSAPAGDHATFEQFGARLKQQQAYLVGGEEFFNYNSLCGKITNKDRSIEYYGYWDGAFTTCQTGNGRQIVKSNNGRPFRRHTFANGMLVEWVNNGLQNNLGRRLEIVGTPNAFGIYQSNTIGVRDPSTSREATFTLSVPNSGPAAITLTATNPMGQSWVYEQIAPYPSLRPTAFEVRPPSTPGQAWFRFDFTSDMKGSVATLSDALGRQTNYWTSTGRVGAVEAPALTVGGPRALSQVRYDRFGQPVANMDPLGRTSTTEYDNHRRKVKATAPEGNYAVWTYDARSNVLTETQHVKPGSGTLPASRTVSTKTYDSLCNMVLTDTDALGRTTTTAINQTTCLVTSVTQPTVPRGTPITTYTYNSIGKVLTTTDPTGLVTQNTYNATNGNLESVIVNPGGFSITTLIAYDAAGNITQLTDPRGFVHTGTYDALRRLTSHTAPASTNAKTKWTYNLDGEITKIERASNAAQTTWATTDYTYWPTGRVKTMTDADGRLTSYEYDTRNRLTLTTDPELRRASKIYDEADQVIEERRAVGSALEQAYSKFAYTLNGKQLWIKDAKDNQTVYEYDGYDRLKKTTFPDATFEVLAYTITDKLDSKLTRGNQLIDNSYDALDREISRLVPQHTGPAITTTTDYDLAGRVTDKSDTAGHSLVYNFDSAKRADWVDQQAPTFAGVRRVSYAYDLASNKTRTTWADGYYVQYAYDGLNRMTTATENGTFLLSTYIYDTLSRRTSLVYGNGASQGYTYSTQGDLLTLASTLTGTNNTYTNTFSKAHQLASEAASNAAWQHAPAVFQTANYAAANPLNQYVNITVGANPTVTMAYDANGNLTGDGVWTFAYDAQNMLRSATKSGGSASYQYDPMGRRQMLTEDGVTTTFLHDGDEEIADYAAAAVLRRYVPGPGTDMPIAIVTPSGGSNTRKYFHTNRQGSTIAMSADNGTLSEGPYTYDAYGNGAPATGVPFKYTGRRLDAGTGLYYYRARYYSAALGRFLQVDPVGFQDQMNLYGYVRNDPLNGSDPTGMIAESPFDVVMVIYDVVEIVYDQVATGGENNAVNGAALVADLGALGTPGVPAVGGLAIRAGQVGVEGAQAVAKGASVESLGLAKSLASEQQTAELMSGGGEVLMGMGTKRVLDDEPRLIAEYGGTVGSWQKVSSTPYKAADGTTVETHAYRNANTGETVEAKSILSESRK